MILTETDHRKTLFYHNYGWNVYINDKVHGNFYNNFFITINRSQALA